MIREMVAAFKRYWAPSLDKIDALDPTLWTPVTLDFTHDFEGGKSYQETQKGAAEYAVTGSPRHIPWSRRKKELEAGARQKRRQSESFREEA